MAKRRSARVTALPKSGSSRHRPMKSRPTKQCGRKPIEKIRTFSRFFESE